MKMQKTLFVVLLVAFLSTLMVAQGSTSKITGKVLSADGTAIPGVLVTATSPKMVGKTVAVSDENGVYRLMNLAPGTYKLTYALDGFATMVKNNVLLKVEQTIRIPITMELKKLKDTITVEGTAPLIDVKSSTQGTTLSKETFNALPKGRDFTSLLKSMPGVSDEPMLSGISVNGASGAENVFYIDGVDVTSITDGSKGQNASFDFVEEMQVKRAGYMAEYGGSLGGVVSAITRSGGNSFHGSILGYYSGSALNGTRRERLRIDKEDATKAHYYTAEELYGPVKYTRLEPGVSLGGYFIKDKVWFFGSFSPTSRKYTNEVTYTDGSGNKSHTTKYNNLNYMFKVSAQLLSSVRWTASYMNDYFSYRGYNCISDPTGWGPYGSSDTDYDKYGFDFPNYSASTSLDITIGNNSMLNIRAGMFYTNQENNQTPIPTVPLYRFREPAAGNYSGTNNKMFPEIPAELQHATKWQNGGFYDSQAVVKSIAEKKSVSGDYTLYFNLSGEHSLKLGGQFVRQGEDVDNAWQQPLVYIGWDRSCIAYGKDYGRGKYGYYGIRGNEKTGPFGSQYKAYSNRIAMYIQDSWTIGEKLTLNFGVRTESEYIPSYSDNPEFADAKPIDFKFGDKIAPRLGFVYDVKGDSTLKVSASYGLFYDVMKLSMAAGSYGGFKWKTALYTLDDYDYTKITKENTPGTFLKLIDYRIPSFDSTDPSIKPMSAEASNITIENKLNDDLSLQVQFTENHLRYTIEDVGVLTPEGEMYYTTNPGFGWSVTEKNGGKFSNKYPDTPKAKRQYYGLSFILTKRFSNNWSGSVSYTWSSLKGNYSGLASSDENGRNSPNVERYFDLWYAAFDKNLNPVDGPLATERPHSLKINGSYLFPFGLTLGTTAVVMSGTPVTEEWVLALPVFPFNRGNLGRTPTYYNVDMLAEYNLKLGKTNLSFSLNVTNIFNFKIAQRIYPVKNSGNLAITDVQILSKNWDYPASAVPDPLFKKEQNYTRPISARLGIKLSF